MPRHFSGDYLLRAAERARRPDREHMQSLRRRVPYWFVVILLFGFAAVQIILNPFGFSDLTQRYTQDIADLLIDGPYLYPETGREQVSVALVDDASLRSLGMPWPWSYGAQARGLDALLAEKPRAVVVDVMFVDPRKDDTISELVDEIGRYRKAGVPLYLVGATDVPAGAPPLRRELLATGVRVLDPGILVNQGIVRQYPVSGSCLGAGARNRAPCLSLALAVYRDLYPQQPLAPLRGLMELVWGTRANPFNAKWMSVTDENGAVHACAEHQDIGWSARMWLAFFDPASVRSACPYTSVIPAESLIEGRDDADIARLAKNHIVFYGASLSGVQDRSFTPVNGLIASVFVHAMALDNLITFHGRPQQNVVTLGSLTLDNNTAQALAVLPIILILGWIHVRGLRRAGAARERGATLEYVLGKLLEKAWHWFAFALALAVGLALTVWAGLSVANWVQVVFVSVEFAALLLVGLPGAVWAYLHHVAVGIRQLEVVQKEQGA
ncbi:MAG TPA: CHASE2 domain-containing protein [Rhizomicrobium sp.]|nr:CHASE2 domain-containing protein [Rhizomicrobium sp.]